MEKMEDLRIEYVPTDSIMPYANNARAHGDADVDAIMASIREFGFRDPIGVWKGIIVEGHGRLLAAKRLGLDRVPVIRLDDMTDEQRRAYALAHNKTAELSQWDFNVLDAELADIADIDMSEFGFDDESVNEDDADIQEDEFDDAVPDAPTCQTGQVWRLGNHRLMCGDSTSADDVAKLMGGCVADIAITSPPYGAGKSAKLRGHYDQGKQQKCAKESFYENYEDDAGGWFELIDSAMANMESSTRAQFVNIQMLASNKTSLLDIIHKRKDHLCDVIIWDKERSAPQMAKNILNNEFEFIFVFGSENCSRSIPYAEFHADRSNIIRIKTGHNEFADIHRAVYPVQLPAEIMKIASRAESVVDLFGGTGTTMIACEQMNRRCYMMELDPGYCDVIIKRWENFTGEKAILM